VTVAGALTCASGSLQTTATLEQNGAALSAVISVTACPTGLSAGVIVGIVIGCVALIACLFVLLLVHKRVTRNVMLRELQSGDVQMRKNPHFNDDPKEARAGRRRAESEVAEENVFWQRVVKVEDVGASLCKAVDSANKNEAVMVKKLSRIANATPREIEVLCRLNHPHIVRLLDSVDDRPNSVCMLLEFLPGGDLRRCRLKMGPFPEALARACFRDVVSGVSYLHGCRIVHRNIRAANCVLDDEGTVKLVDFGMAARFAEDTLFYDFGGAASHDAPEIRQLVPYRGPPTDVWALGVTLFEIVMGTVPFGERPVEFDAPEALQELPRHLGALLGQLLNLDPRRREEASMLIGSDWFYEKLPHVDPSLIMHSGLRQRTLREGNGL
jgi:serine/threonine protein kinase